jgi:hypothetical protein
MATEHAAREAEKAQEEKRDFPAHVIEIPLTKALRISGASAGDLHGALMREALLAKVQANGDALGTVKIGLTRLQSRGLLKGSEVRGLAYICGLVFAAAHNERDPNEVCPKVRE